MDCGYIICVKVQFVILLSIWNVIFSPNHFLMLEFAEKTKILQNEVESCKERQSLVVLMVGWFYFFVLAKIIILDI